MHQLRNSVSVYLLDPASARPADVDDVRLRTMGSPSTPFSAKIQALSDCGLVQATGSTRAAALPLWRSLAHDGGALGRTQPGLGSAFSRGRCPARHHAGDRQSRPTPPPVVAHASGGTRRSARRFSDATGLEPGTRQFPSSTTPTRGWLLLSTVSGGAGVEAPLQRTADVSVEQLLWRASPDDVWDPRCRRGRWGA